MGPGAGGAFGIGTDSFCNQQVVKLRALEFATAFIRAVGWPAAWVVGDISVVWQMFGNAKAGVG